MILIVRKLYRVYSSDKKLWLRGNNSGISSATSSLGASGCNF